MSKKHKLFVPIEFILYMDELTDRSLLICMFKEKKVSIWDFKNLIQQWVASMILGLLFCLFVCFLSTFLGSSCESNVVRLRRMGVNGREGMTDLVSTKTKHLLVQ